MFVNGRFLTQRITGVQRFAREMTQASTENGFWNRADTSFVAPQDDALSSEFSGLSIRHTGCFKGHVWEQVDLPRVVDDALLINLCNTGPVLKRRQIVVLHDAAVAVLPQNFTPAFRAWYQTMIRLYGRHAQIIGTVSCFSAGEITKYFGIPSGKIEIIPESGEHILREAADDSLHRKFDLETDGYFLAVSSRTQNKNFEGIIKAVAQLPPLPFKFVIVGGSDAKVFSAAPMNGTGAVEVGYASDAQLRALYERAACFVYPSFYEGFGLPPLEAMSCGCPVLVANGSSLPEICGAGATYCDPYDPGDIAKKLSLLLGSQAARNEARAAGLARAKEWTWEKAARHLHEISSGV
jgi:glycosyltransferase involved in cell wall biosynthesis